MTEVSIPNRGPRGEQATSTSTRILSGLLLARDRRDEFQELPDGSWMVPSRSTHTRHNATADVCTCPDSRLGGYRCSHRVALLAVEVARSECRGKGYEQDLRVDAVLDLMVRIQSPAPSWASERWVEVEAAKVAEEARSLVGVSERLRDMLAGSAIARRDLAWAEVR